MANVSFDKVWQQIDGAALGETWTQGTTISPPTGSVVAAPALPRLHISRNSNENGEYTLGGILGQGGGGVVLEATQAALNRPVALKCANSGTDSHNALIREAIALGKLQHPNIVPVYALGVDEEDHPVLVMKRIEGASWRMLLDHPDHATWAAFHSDTRKRNLDVLLIVIRAVQFAHSQGVLHLDLKPENVVVGSLGEVYVIDWGLALSLEEAAQGRNYLAGTPSYMAPELAQPGMPLGVQSDVYLLGAILYELTTGNPPHHGDSLSSVTEHILAQELPQLAHVEAELAGVITKAMAYHCDNRFQSAESLYQALKQYREHEESRHLTRAAQEKALELHDALQNADIGRVDRVIGECQFGFEAALSGWPENPDARTGLAKALDSVITFDLAHGQVDAASRLLSRHDAASLQLRSAVQAAEERALHDADDLRVLRDERTGLDARTGRGSRRFTMPGLILVLVAGPMLLGALRLAGVLAAEGRMFQRAGFLLILTALSLHWLWRRPPTNLYNRRLLAVGNVVLAVLCVNWTVAGLLGAGPSVAISQSLLSLAAALGAGAVLLDRRLGWGAGCAVIGALLGAMFPERAEFVLGAANAGMLWSVHLSWRQMKRESGVGGSHTD